jgi:hypothetical protein
MFPRKTLSFAAVALGLCSLPAAADVMVRSKVAVSGMVSMQGESVTYIKGHRMRIESKMGNHSSTMLMDLDAKRTVILDGKKAEAFDLSKMMQQQALIDDASVKFDIKPTGKSRQVAGQSCEEHQIDVSVHTKAGPDNPMGNMDVNMSGPGCTVKGAPGLAEYLAFYEHAAKTGYFFGDPRAAQAQPGRERAMTLMQKKMAEAGLPYWSSFKLSFKGEGPMAAMMANMAMSTETTVTEVSTAPLADSLFEVPAGVKVKNN